MNNNSDWKGFLKTMIIALPISIVFTFFIENCAGKNRADRERNIRYEIEIIDKYDCIGGNWHLVGGRSSEQEYHIIYKVTPLTEAAKKEYYGDGEEDDEVDYKVYRKIEIGKKFTGTRSYLLYYY